MIGRLRKHLAFLMPIHSFIMASNAPDMTANVVEWRSLEWRSLKTRMNQTQPIRAEWQPGIKTTTKKKTQKVIFLQERGSITWEFSTKGISGIFPSCPILKAVASEASIQSVRSISVFDSRLLFFYRHNVFNSFSFHKFACCFPLVVFFGHTEETEAQLTSRPAALPLPPVVWFSPPAFLLPAKQERNVQNCLHQGTAKTRVLISIKAPRPTSSSSLICNLNLSHSHHKWVFLGVLVSILFKFIFTYLQL